MGLLAGVPWSLDTPAYSTHGCWSGVSPPSHLLGKTFAWGPSAVTCEIRNLCYRPSEGDFEYFTPDAEDKEAVPPAIGIWSGASEPVGGGYNAPVKNLPLQVRGHARGREPFVALPTYILVRSDSQNWGHMLHDMFLPLLTLMSQAEELGEPNGQRLVLFPDDCNPESEFNTVPAVPKHRPASRATCERITGALISIVSDFPWLDGERLRHSRAPRVCFAEAYAGTGRWSWLSQPPAHEAGGLYGTTMRLLRDWAHRRLTGVGPGQSRAQRDVLGLLRKPQGTRRAVANIDEVQSWLQAWASDHSLRFMTLHLAELSLAEQLRAFQQIRIYVTPAGSSHTASSIFMPDWTTVIVIPQCGGCRPTEGVSLECHVDTLYARPCSVEEFGFDQVWPRPKLWLMWYPADLHRDTVERVGHLDVVVGFGRLMGILEQAWRLHWHSKAGEAAVAQASSSFTRNERSFHFRWPEILQMPLVMRCPGEDNTLTRVRTCTVRLGTEGQVNHCNLVHKRDHDKQTTSAELPELGACACEPAQLEVNGDPSWNWQQLTNPAFLRMILAKHHMGLLESYAIESQTHIYFAMPYTGLGWYGHPSLLELFRRRSFFEDTHGPDFDCADPDDCAFKRALTLLEWILLARTVVRDVIAPGDGWLKTNTITSLQRCTSAVDAVYDELLQSLDSPLWRPSLLVLLHSAQQELATDFGQHTPMSEFSEACGGKVKVRDPREATAEVQAWVQVQAQAQVQAEHSWAAPFLRAPWLARLCALDLPEARLAGAAATPTATAAATAAATATAVSNKEGQSTSSDSQGLALQPFCQPHGSVVSLPGVPGTVIHILGQALSRPTHPLLGGAAEAEVVLYVEGVDGCTGEALDKARLLLSSPSAALYAWTCLLDDGHTSSRAVGLPVALHGFTLHVICPVPESMWPRGRQDPPGRLLLRLQAEPQGLDLPVALCSKSTGDVESSSEKKKKEKVRLALCLGDVYDLPGLINATGVPTLMSDWFSFYLLAGVSLFALYDVDGSIREAAPSVVDHPTVKYYPRFADFLKMPHRASAEHQAHEHCISTLRSEADWIATVPGLDTLFWRPSLSTMQAAQVPWLRQYLEGLEPHRRDLAALQLSEVQFAAPPTPAPSPSGPAVAGGSKGEVGHTLLTRYQYRSPARRHTPLSSILNPDNIIENSGHFSVPRPGAILVNVSDRVLRVNHYIDFAHPSGPSRCEDCTELDQSLGIEMEQLLQEIW